MFKSDWALIYSHFNASAFYLHYSEFNTVSIQSVGGTTVPKPLMSGPTSKNWDVGSTELPGSTTTTSEPLTWTGIGLLPTKGVVVSGFSYTLILS
jgi:hypothetical protein